MCNRSSVGAHTGGEEEEKKPECGLRSRNEIYISAFGERQRWREGWRWTVRQRIAAEGQTAFTAGCHGSGANARFVSMGEVVR